MKADNVERVIVQGSQREGAKEMVQKLVLDSEREKREQAQNQYSARSFLTKYSVGVGSLCSLLRCSLPPTIPADQKDTDKLGRKVLHHQSHPPRLPARCLFMGTH